MITTRGLAPSSSRDPRDCENRFYAFAVPYVWLVQPERQKVGIDLSVASVRRTPPESLDPRIKNFQWGDMVAGLFEAYDKGGETTVLLDRDGNVTEGPGFNLFALIGGRLVTPRGGVLEGITRKTIIELAGEAGWPVTLVTLPVADLARAEEVFLTSTAGGVIPVGRIDGRPVGDGRPGPVALRLRELYWAAHEDPKYTTPVDYRGTEVAEVR
jgi:branched-subunit amino acid aminotransferase/4-amino-4-deoxychorismate lyase